jgi:hypothetical protein
MTGSKGVTEMLSEPIAQVVLWALVAVLLVAYLARRRARLRREE